MIAVRVTTQAEIDAKLLELGLKPTGKKTSDGTQQLYINKEGRGFLLPHSEVEGYSYYSVTDVLAHVQKAGSCLSFVETRSFLAEKKKSVTDTAVQTKKNTAKKDE